MQGLSSLISPGEWFLRTLKKTATAPLRREFRCEVADMENTQYSLECLYSYISFPVQGCDEIL